MTSIIFINRFFAPDYSATSQLVSDLAFYLADRGWRVNTIAGRRRYDDPEAVLPAAQTVGGVRVTRVWTSRFGRGNLLGRSLDYLTFYVSAAWRLWRTVGRGDVVVVKTDPPLFAVPAALVCALRGARHVQWAQDLFPEVAGAYGLRIARGPLGGLLRCVRNQAYRRSVVCVALGDAMARRLKNNGIARDRIRVIPNWSDGEHIRPLPASANRLRAEWHLEGCFVVGYSGNFGRAHDIETVLGAAESLADRDETIRFLLIGGGARRARVEAFLCRRPIANIELRPYQPWDRLRYSLTVADLHLVSLHPEMEGLLFPSKLYGVLAAGRPVLFIGDPEGEAASLVRDNECGMVVAANDAEGLVDTIVKLKADPDRVTHMGEQARALFERRFSAGHAMARWERLLSEVAGAGAKSRDSIHAR